MMNEQEMLIVHEVIPSPAPAPAHVMIGSSPVTQELRSKIDLIANSDAAVLITGESGTGKEVVARQIHSRRQHTSFVAVNCAALPKDVIENELFGHEKGAFTGAQSRHVGCFELADGGTLFLDEVSEMHPQTQAKLLRAVEEKAFRRLGGREEISVNPRIVSATNKHIDQAIASGQLREDLFYRLSVFEINLKPLRERSEDVGDLLRFYLDRFCHKYSKPGKHVTPEAVELLAAYDWPGNVRELRNVAERMVLVSEDRVLSAQHLEGRISRRGKDRSAFSISIPVRTTLKSVERTVILSTLDSVENNKSKAARILGISRRTLHEKLKSFRHGTPDVRKDQKYK